MLIKFFYRNTFETIEAKKPILEISLKYIPGKLLFLKKRLTNLSETSNEYH